MKQETKEMIKKILLFIHQLPQNILGLLVILFTGAEKNNAFYWRTSKYRFGVSLGSYIIFGAISDKYILWQSVKHEQGHQKQSLFLGWLYLIIIGLPSAAGNIWDRFAHRNWPYWKREQWYYNQPWEKWADKLVKVNRFTNLETV